LFYIILFEECIILEHSITFSNRNTIEKFNFINNIIHLIKNYLYNEIKEKYGNETTYLSILVSGGQIFVFDSAGVGGILYEDMGLNKPAKLPVQDTISLPVVSYEGLLEIDSDYIILIGTDEDINALKQSPIYNNLNAVKNNNVIELPSSPYFNMVYSSIGRDLFVNQFVDLMEN